MSDFSPDDFVPDLNIYRWLDVETESVDEVVSCMINSIMEILDKHAPIKHYVQPVWFTNDIKQRILARDREKHNGYFQQFKILRNEVVKMVRRAKSLHYHKIIEMRLKSCDRNNCNYISIRNHFKDIGTFLSKNSLCLVT